MPLNAQIALSIVAHETSSGDLSRTLRATPASFAMSLADGTGANQAQVAWSDARTLGIGSVDVVAMRSLSDDRGTVSFSAIKALYLRNTHQQNQIDLRYGTSFANYWQAFGFVEEGNGETIIPPGCAIAMLSPTAAGWGVGDGTDSLHLYANQGTTYEIVLIGEGTIT